MSKTVDSDELASTLATVDRGIRRVSNKHARRKMSRLPPSSFAARGRKLRATNSRSTMFSKNFPEWLASYP
jgi:hypothetical protein